MNFDCGRVKMKGLYTKPFCVHLCSVSFSCFLVKRDTVPLQKAFLCVCITLGLMEPRILFWGRVEAVSFAI